MKPLRVATSWPRSWSGKLRPSWDEYFLNIAHAVALRASCPRAMCGAVLVDDNHRIVGTGYNGAPAGTPDCMTAGCILEDNHCVRSIHAEMNAILNAAKYGAKTENATAYVWSELPDGSVYPACTRCRLHLEGAGVSAIIEH